MSETKQRIWRLPHTNVARGKKVLVVLRSGEQFEDRFIERTKNKRLVFEGRTIPVGEVRQFITSPKIIKAKTT